MNNDYIRNAFKSLEDLKVVIEPVKTPLLHEDVDLEPEEDNSNKTIADLFKEANSYILTKDFDCNGKYVMFMEALHDGESCDILYDEFDIENINEVLFEILDEEHDFIDSLHATEFTLDSKFEDVVKSACSQLNGEPGLEDDGASDEQDEHDKNVRDFVGDEEPKDKDGEGDLPPVEVEMEPADIKDVPAEEPQEESLNADKKFIKTRNSKVDAIDLAAELDANDIEYEMAEDGLFVSAKDFNKVQSMLDQLEMDDTDESLDESQKFNLQDEGEVKEAEDILNRDEGDAIEQIVDASAETVDDLQKTYIGSIILQCPTCKTMIYKNPDQLVKSEDADDVIYNVDEECPHCGAKDGFELIGQVASLSVNPDGEPTPPAEETPEDKPEDKPEESEESKEPASPMPELPPEEPANEELKEDIDDEDYEEIEFFPGDEGDIEAEKFIKKNRLKNVYYDWDDYRKGYYVYRESLNTDTKFVKEWAEEDYANGQVFDSDDYDEWAKVANESGIKPSQELFSYYFDCVDNCRSDDNSEDDSLNEDTVKQGDKWVNKGKEGTHGEFKTKKAADAQRKAMFANGYKEECEDGKCNVKLESFDEIKYDKLITRYLKENYANVNTYKTVFADIDDKANKIIIEGVILFKSGKEKNTKFVFEAKEITKKNQIKFVGINEAFSKNKAYTLLGQVNNNKLISESLSYNYTAGDKKVKGKIEPLRKR